MCGTPYPVEPLAICEECFGPLEVDYDYDAIRVKLTREEIAKRPKTLWRYRELLPVDGEPTVGLQTGYTPLVRAERLAKALGVTLDYLAGMYEEEDKDEPAQAVADEGTRRGKGSRAPHPHTPEGIGL